MIHTFSSVGVCLLAGSCFRLLDHKVTNLVSQWKRKACEELLDVFERGPDGGQRTHEKEIRSLHAKIGQLVVERDLFGTALGR